MVTKKDGSWGACGDYRLLNQQTEPDRYRIPHIQDFARDLHGAKIFSKIDLVKAYRQIPMLLYLYLPLIVISNINYGICMFGCCE